MEEVSVWTQIARELGVRQSKLHGNQRLFKQNIDKIQGESAVVKIMLQSSDDINSEIQKYCTQFLLHLEKELAKQTDFLVLSSIRLVMIELNTITSKVNSNLKVKKILKSCVEIKAELEKYTNRPYSDIVRMALDETDKNFCILQWKVNKGYEGKIN